VILCYLIIFNANTHKKKMLDNIRNNTTKELNGIMWLYK